MRVAYSLSGTGMCVLKYSLFNSFSAFKWLVATNARSGSLTLAPSDQEMAAEVARATDTLCARSSGSKTVHVSVQQRVCGTKT